MHSLSWAVFGHISCDLSIASWKHICLCNNLAIYVSKVKATLIFSRDTCVHESVDHFLARGIFWI